MIKKIIEIIKSKLPIKLLNKNLIIGDLIYFLFFIFFIIIISKCFIIKINTYETIIYILFITFLIYFNYFFRFSQILIISISIISILAITLYGNDYYNNDKVLILKYLLTSQSLIIWQLFFISITFILYIFDLLSFIVNKKENNMKWLFYANFTGILSTILGLSGLLVRWYESYLLFGNDGHIPVSNLYEVLILFLAMMSLMFYYYSKKDNVNRLGLFIYFLEGIIVIFLLWYSLTRDAVSIKPLVPALQSWWMKIHVPANFIGYSGFCIAATIGLAQLISTKQEENQLKYKKTDVINFLPKPIVIEKVMYQLISIGFLFFTIATVLGAFWGGDAWGRYWGWDPKETWALIVWLNYAIWLHMRLVKGWRGKILAYWAIIGFFITVFTFIGINFLSTGLHSYGKL